MRKPRLKEAVCQSKVGTGRVWPPSRGCLPHPTVPSPPCLGRRPCSSELEEWPGFPVPSHLLTFLLSQRSPPWVCACPLQNSGPNQMFGAGRADARRLLGRRGRRGVRKEGSKRNEGGGAAGYGAPWHPLEPPLADWETVYNEIPRARPVSPLMPRVPVLRGGFGGGLHLAIRDTVLSAG